MGAEQTFLVEVEVLRKEVRVSYGVTGEEALSNVGLDPGERTTGRVWQYMEKEKALEWVETQRNKGG